ncbi:hypothetical protein VTO42DRAFT_441 [Malbranchea cinnamomea]
MAGHDNGDSVTKLLTTLLPSRDNDQDFWWKFIAPKLALLLREAEYPIERQYEALLFLYHYVVPSLGSSPFATDKVKKRSYINNHGQPVLFCWKWNVKPDVSPEVRITVDPVSQYTGTALDPLNRIATEELLHRVSDVYPDIDLTLFHHFLASFFDHNKDKYVQELKAGKRFGSTTVSCFEILRKGLLTKVYFVPRYIGQTDLLPLEWWDSAIREFDPHNGALDVVRDFIRNNPEGRRLTPYMLAIDNVKPSSSRFKLYFGSPITDFASVREVLTLGGLITGIDKQLQSVQDLMKATMPSVQFSNDAEVPNTNSLPNDHLAKILATISGYIWYFDVAPGMKIPDIKFYIPLRNFPEDDLTQAKSLTAWMEAHGRSKYCPNYLRMLEGLAVDGKLAESHGLHSYVSCTIKKSGELDLSSYISVGGVLPKVNVN